MTLSIRLELPSRWVCIRTLVAWVICFSYQASVHVNEAVKIFRA